MSWSAYHATNLTYTCVCACLLFNSVDQDNNRLDRSCWCLIVFDSSKTIGQFLTPVVHNRHLGNDSSTVCLLHFYPLEQLDFAASHLSILLYAFIILPKISDSLSMHPEHTLIHHKSHVNAIAINPECNRLLSGGKRSAKWLPGITLLTFSTIPGDDAELIVWNLSIGEMMQNIWCPFFGAISAIVCLPAMPRLGHGFAFGCANGSIHIYTCNDTLVSFALFLAPA